MCKERAVGITTTVPIEIILAAGWKPVDLNNVFITHAQPAELVEQAERAAFPRNMCAWIKGIYAIAQTCQIRTVVATTEGDCSNTRALIEMLQADGIRVIPFGYPYGRDEDLLGEQMERMAAAFGVTMHQAEAIRQQLAPLRRVAREIDERTYTTGQVSGEENHFWLISCSDMFGSPADYLRRAREFLAEAQTREHVQRHPRVALLGIPPICSGLFDFLEELGAMVVFNEMQRQFSMPYECDSLLEQYRRYTYPYDVFFRLEDVVHEMAERAVDGVIHYVQSFCFRQIQDRIVRERLPVPILTLEGDRPGALDNRSKTRIEAFIEMLRSADTSPRNGIARHAVS